MTGPEHYKEAEGLLADVADGNSDPADSPHLLAMAQVHATLALAAATAVRNINPEWDASVEQVQKEWGDAILPNG